MEMYIWRIRKKPPHYRIVCSQRQKKINIAGQVSLPNPTVQQADIGEGGSVLVSFRWLGTKRPTALLLTSPRHWGNRGEWGGVGERGSLGRGGGDDMPFFENVDVAR